VRSHTMAASDHSPTSTATGLLTSTLQVYDHSSPVRPFRAYFGLYRAARSHAVKPTAVLDRVIRDALRALHSPQVALHGIPASEYHVSLSRTVVLRCVHRIFLR
jgi:hypothetical protein